jgi:hypothetical protein
MEMTLLRPAAALVFTLMLLTAIGSCRSPSRSESARLADDSGRHFSTLVDNMTGWFTSAAQAEREPKNYFEIRLVMTPIWTERSDAVWLYVEQAAAGALDRPYRQRVYRVSPLVDGRYESVVYTLPGEPLTYAGAWRDPRAFAALSPADLVLREGCSMVLDYIGNSTFVGSTTGTGCGSSLAGAAYATSEVTITSERLESWDRGFDADGEQVWGATNGPYIFDKVSSPLPDA